MKKPLSRDVIVAEALRQLTSEGIGGMSLRKVALALETGPASLYAYVNDLRELHALVLDRALGAVTIPEPVGPWRERVRSLLKGYVLVLCASPGLAQLAFGTIAVGPNALRITEALLGLLDEGGIDVATSAWAVDLLVLYVTAIAAEHAGGLPSLGPETAVARAFASITAGEYPRIHASRDHLLSGTGEDRFGWAIDVLLQGILGTARSRGGDGAVTARRSPRKKSRRRGA